MNVVICGNNVASLVAARKLLNQGHSVTMVSPSAAPGGFFKGYEFRGARVDIGMVLVELDSFNLDANATLTGYSLSRKNDSGRFVSIIRQYFDELGVQVNEVSTPKMFFDGAFGGIYHDLSQ